MSSQAESLGPLPVRGQKRWKAALNLDLNVPPPVESGNHNQEGTSSEAVNRGMGVSEQGQFIPPATIDVEAIDDDDDDDVVVASATAFAAARNNARRTRGRASTVVIDVDSGATSRGSSNNRNRQRRVPPNQTIINCETYINLEAGVSSLESVHQAAPPPLPPPPPPPPPPPEPSFSCPICMGPFVEEMSTKCGHIFCKGCIKAAIAKQAKCPTCRKRATVKELIRVFLPDAR